MNSSIEAIFFDVGGTLRMSQKADCRDLDTISAMQKMIGDRGKPQDFAAMLQQRENEYRQWARKTLIELREEDLWARFMLPGQPEEFLRENAIRLNQMWRDSSPRTLLPDAILTLRTLAERGFRLGIISNTTSTIEVPRVLEENGITDLFGVVILSCAFGKRKPHPSLFLAAAREVGVPVERCAYLGDKTARDLIGARQAGFGQAGLINTQGYSLDGYDPDDEMQIDAITEMKPDFKIGKLSELLEIYPQRIQTAPGRISGRGDVPTQPECLYDAALSTMWGLGQDMPFNDTFAAGRQAGFTRFELNHQVTPELYAQWDTNRFYIATVHDPCPAEFSDAYLKKADLLVSSLDETRRRKGVDRAKRTIDLACRLGARSVVLHPGAIAGDSSRDRRLRELFQKGMRETNEYQDLAAELITHRASLAAAHVDQVAKSLLEIIEFARGAGVSIGLENRYRYYDIPLPDEMERLLLLCDEDWYGFQYDSGHAQVLSALGLVDRMEWLDRFSSRMIGAHLHDVVGLEDHQPPGCGDIDFKIIGPYIPETAQRTLEINPRASLEDLADGLGFLADSGCIYRL